MIDELVNKLVNDDESALKLLSKLLDNDGNEAVPRLVSNPKSENPKPL